METTLVLLKPDCVYRNMIGPVITRLEQKGLSIHGAKMLKMDEAMFAQHYAEHQGASWYDQCLSFMMSGPVLALAVRGYHAVINVRNLLGATNCCESKAGTIRGDFGTSITNNLVHAAATLGDAERELKIFFKDGEIFDR